MISTSVSESITIRVPAPQVWLLVGDLPRMGEWSPENEGCVWTHGASSAEPGARFTGRNRNGRRRWSTSGVITEALPGKRLTFEIRVGPVLISRWSYVLASTADACTLTERWDDLRPRWFVPIGRLAAGVKDREAHKRAGMRATLAAIRVAAEREPTTADPPAAGARCSPTRSSTSTRSSA